MTATFSEFMKTQMAAGYDWTSKIMGLVLLHSSVAVNASTPNDLAGFLAAQGFQEVDNGANVCPTYKHTGPGTAVAAVDQQTVGPSVTAGVTTVIYGSDFTPILVATPPAQDYPVYVAAGLFFVVGTVAGVLNPWVMLTDDAFGAVLNPGVRISGPPHPITGLAQRKLFSYSKRDVSATTVDIAPEAIVRTPGVVEWESARIQHVFVYPQRVNWIPNPSFEEPGLFGWRSNGAMTRLQPGVDNPGNFYCHTAGTILESIPVPAKASWRLSAWVKSATATQVQLVLASLDGSYVQQAVTPDHYRPLYTTWIRYDAILVGSDDSPAVVARIQANGAFDCDLVMLEATDALNPYYDGDSNLGAPGDFSWQSVEAKSYSFYYTNRNVTAARLFGSYIPDGQVTGESALVKEWMPTGTTVHTHWDVLSPTDTRHPLEDWGSRTMP